MKAINANLEKIGEAKIELAKIHAETRVKTRAIMTEEQRIMMDSKKHKMRQGEGRDRDFARGPENGRNKQRAQQGR